METVRGIIDHDTIRLVTPLSLPQGTEIEFEPRVIQEPDKPPVSNVLPSNPANKGTRSIDSNDGMEAIYAILRRGHDTGISDLAERHNEHQP
jgi:hypothetical protein